MVCGRTRQTDKQTDKNLGSGRDGQTDSHVERKKQSLKKGGEKKILTVKQMGIVPGNFD